VIRQGSKEDIASPGPRDTSRDPTGKGETPVDPVASEQKSLPPDLSKPSGDSVSTAPEPARGRKISGPVVKTGATAGSVTGTGAVPNSSSKTRASITRGMTQSEAQAVIDFNEAQAEKEQQLRDHLHGQKRFADLLTELAESFQSRWSHLPAEPHPDPKSRDTAYIRAGHEKRLAGLRQDWLDAESRVTLWTPWQKAEARKARAVFDVALEALGYRRHDIGKLDMNDDSNFLYAIKWMADWVVRSREHKHRDWMNLPEVKTYLTSKAEMARLMDHLKRTEDVELLLIAKTRPEEAMKRLANTLHMPDAGLGNPPQTRPILKNRSRQNQPSSLTL